MTGGMRYELRFPKEKRAALTAGGLIFGVIGVVACTWFAISCAVRGTSPTVRLVGTLFGTFFGLASIEFFGSMIALGRISRIEIDNQEIAIIGAFQTNRIAIDDVERIYFVRRYPRMLGIVPILRGGRAPRMVVTDCRGRDHMLWAEVESFIDDNSGKDCKSVLREVLGDRRFPPEIPGDSQFS